ncbi:MAG: hypothetical protein BWK78_04920 [Thiotrichaceae bacterium IS1]|jgi:hypothetical protein|nr:MAG: hypothetical protein BWK78_04920 [Thiotrichaceae bacterium IS1]
MRLKDRPLVDFLLLEYLWNRNFAVGLESYAHPKKFFESNNLIHHGLDMETLVERLSSLLEDGMFLLNREHFHSGIQKIYLNKEELKNYLVNKSSPFNSAIEYPPIYIRLSFKGGKTWEQTVQADWSKYYTHLGLSTRDIRLESTNKHFLSKVLNFYLDNLILASDCNVKLTTFKPWFPYTVHWKQFARGYQYQFKVLKESFSREALSELQKLKIWRHIWVKNEDKGLMLIKPEVK